MEVHSVEFPGRDVDSLRRKYTSVHCKKVPIGDPNILEEIRLAKKVKCMIKDWAQFGGKEEDYDMISDCFGGESVGLDNDDETAGSPLTPPPPPPRRPKYNCRRGIFAINE